MRLAAVIAGLASVACFGVAAWLYVWAHRIYSSDAYAPDHVVYVGTMAADGSGIFIPVAIAAAAGVFFAVFAVNLWRKP